jgi:hypothetical protein
MQSPNMMSTVPVPWRSGCLGASTAQSTTCRLAQEQLKNHQFVDLLNAFRRSGGLARVPEVAARFHSCSAHDVSPLAGWINKREVISFEWQSMLWMPLFQFNPSSLTLRAGLKAVLAELVGIDDDWELATWFAQPNPWLADCTPADTLAVAAPEVLSAARAERFVEVG